MKNSQKGFIIPLIIIIVAVLAIGGSAYYVSQKNKTSLTERSSNISSQSSDHASLNATTTSSQPIIQNNSETSSQITITKPAVQKTANNCGAVSSTDLLNGTMTDKEKISATCADNAFLYCQPATTGLDNGVIKINGKVGNNCSLTRPIGSSVSKSSVCMVPLDYINSVRVLALKDGLTDQTKAQVFVGLTIISPGLKDPNGNAVDITCK